MKKRNLLPTQTAPVERDNTAASCQGEKGLSSAMVFTPFPMPPFAGDDAE
ncbi:MULTISPECIES: anacyclamide/piricyclamide family prenylated cyclic peptide [unclassified Anabaena]